MRIVVDINHPAHVHFFKNFIWEMKKRGHKILITASKKEMTCELLDKYSFDYKYLGSYGDSPIKKLLNIPLMDLKMYLAVKNFKPDIFVGLASVRAAHISKLLRKPYSITFYDTEHAFGLNLLFMPFTDVFLSPFCYKKDLGRKHIRYNGFHELAYLHPKYFKPNPNILKELRIKKDEKFFVLRFVSWEASHDIGQSGLDIKAKRKLVAFLDRHGKVLISSEKNLPKEFEKYRFQLSPEKIHDALYYAGMYIGEGATMATESAILGTPAIYISSLVGSMGNFIELEKKYDLIYSFGDFDRAYNKIKELSKRKNLQKEWQRKRTRLLQDKIDVTGWMVKFIENYPGL